MSFRTPGRFGRLAPLAAAGMAFAVVLGACGSSATPTPTPPPDPKAMLAQSAASVAALKSFHIVIELSGTLTNPTPSAGSPASMTLDGTKLSADVDIANQKGSASLVVPPALLALAMSGASPQPSASAIPSGDLADLVVSGDLYFKVPLMASTLGTDKWVKVSAASLQALATQYSGILGGAIPSMAPAASASPDLAAITAFLTSSGITVASQGTDSCADGTCNKTVVTVPASALQQLAALGAASGSALGSNAPDLSSLGNLGPTTVTIWTGTSNNRFNKLSVGISAGSAGTVTISVSLSNFDQPITVTVPPADQVTSFPGL